MNCACGCGEQAGAGSQYAQGHHWRVKTPKSYRQAMRADGVKVRVHRIRAERALGRPLPWGVQVHHVDGTVGDHSQLVICESDRYHKLLHARTRIVTLGGNPNTQKWCPQCEALKPRTEFSKNRVMYAGLSNLCRPCHSAEVVAYKQRKRLRGVA